MADTSTPRKQRTASASPPAGTGPPPEEGAGFRDLVYAWWRTHPRSLPWRETADPYAILVSEVMLQQTRVDRVVGKYADFLRRFPDFATLAAAPLQELLAAWQGLGYNRRAVALKKCAEAVAAQYGGVLPESVEALQALPGIGPYTARAIAAFAFDLPTVFIETNIRAALIHHFLGDREGVRDAEILPLVAATLDRFHPRAWYNALMDYGAMLKKAHGNPARRSAHHARQTPFKGSNRELRGRILKALLAVPGRTAQELGTNLGAEPAAVHKNLLRMEKEGLVAELHGRFTIR